MEFHNVGMDDDDDQVDGVFNRPLIQGTKNSLWRLQNNSSLHYIASSELKGYECFFRHLCHISSEVCNIFCDI